MCCLQLTMSRGLRHLVTAVLVTLLLLLFYLSISSDPLMHLLRPTSRSPSMLNMQGQWNSHVVFAWTSFICNPLTNSECLANNLQNYFYVCWRHVRTGGTSVACGMVWVFLELTGMAEWSNWYLHCTTTSIARVLTP